MKLSSQKFNMTKINFVFIYFLSFFQENLDLKLSHEMITQKPHQQYKSGINIYKINPQISKS